MLARIMFIANVPVAGLAGAAVLFRPERAAEWVFQGAASIDSGTKIVGAMWLAIALLSVLGAVRPDRMWPVLLVQLLYKGAWLGLVAGPALFQNRAGEVPMGVSIFFAIWVVLLTAAIPWRRLVSG